MSDPDEFVTVAEAAARLGTTIPRLRRILARPEYREQKREQERKTRTGTRTATVVSVSILDDLARSLSTEPARNRNENDSEPKQEQEQHQIVDDRQALIDQLRSENTFLRGALEAASVERAELRRLLLIEQDAVKRLTSGPMAAAVDPATEIPAEREPDTGAVLDTSMQATVDAPHPSSAANHPPDDPKAAGTAPEAAKRGFWQSIWKALIDPWGGG